MYSYYKVLIWFGKKIYTKRFYGKNWVTVAISMQLSLRWA